MRADEVAKALGKSTSTAYTCSPACARKGFAVHESQGVYRSAQGLEQLTAEQEQSPACTRVSRAPSTSCSGGRASAHLGTVKPGRIEIVAVRGRQGVRRMPGLGSEIRDSAHALAMGKVVLSLLEPAGLARYVARGLKPFTPQTITSPEVLSEELELVRRDGFAVDREEFDEDFCCIAAPILDDNGRFVAALGLSITAPRVRRRA